MRRHRRRLLKHKPMDSSRRCNPKTRRNRKCTSRTGDQPHPGEPEQPSEQALPGQPATPPGGEQPQHSREDLVPDGKHSWTVAVGAAWNVFCCSLLRRAMPVMFLAVGDAFATNTKGPVAWMNAFIYSLAYLLCEPLTLI
ncbi:hypothetical protein HPB51_027762 [Rhipicephalus microplus]|uniref:Uncharacterized protein n=1 Tax=Rhipicephalus microplus TaxID=6941 RepID=A0A9J6CZ10_RHIMP|nr:hypothetical protein HPB51_027762 [Rhipicephalus microplus]